ncbi:V-type ATPase subunit [Candidatus Micrarchaeota archaeon]|nr:V-type ATPase subunit [Candidatus Micrarchaeota archaeon]
MGFNPFYSRALVYGYSNARVKARKAMLLSKTFLEDLASQRTIDAMIEMLQRTRYKDSIGRFSGSVKGADLIELAAGADYAEVAEKVFSFAPEDAKDVIKAVLGKWDIHNLKTIIAFKRISSKWEKARSYMIPAGTLRLHQLERIFKAEPGEIYNVIRKTRAGREILGHSSEIIRGTELEKRFMSAVKDASVLSQLQVILDASMYEFLNKPISSDSDMIALRKIIRLTIDAKNLINIMRLKKHNVTDEETLRKYIIRGGTFNNKMIHDMITAEGLENTFKVVKRIFPVEFSKDEVLSDLESKLDKVIARKRITFFYRSNLSLGTLVGFLFVKEEEMNNLRKIARAREGNLSEEEVKKMLIV